MCRLPFVESKPGPRRTEPGRVSSGVRAGGAVVRQIPRRPRRGVEWGACGWSGRGGAWSVFGCDALDVYAVWSAPSAIVSGGAYGVGGFPGDPRTAEGLTSWYEPHVSAWAVHARPASTLWFYCA